ncbi:MAG: hypothetical protein JNN12_01910 [Bacteroidetes Order II. Incertae sedis bacterium]|nr:hypothetical protein [Bacteroidetes Order II. bacterium]
MLAEARNMAALFFLDHELSDLRASFMQFALERGVLPPPDKWEKLENEVIQGVKKQYFNQEVTNALFPEKNMTAHEDYEKRTTKDSGEATLWHSHELLKNIPFHGHPDYLES